MRSPEEILKIIDQAQARLDDLHEGAFNLRDLVWEVIEDVSSSYELVLLPLIGENLTMEVNNVVGDYNTNHYGDDL